MDFKSSKISPWLTLFAFITLYGPFISINALFDNTKKTETFSSWYSVFCTVWFVWTVEVWSQPLEKSRLFRFSFHYSTLHNTWMDPYICSKGCRRDGWLEGRKLKIISPHQLFKPHKTRNPGVNSCLVQILPGNRIANREWRGASNKYCYAALLYV